MIQASCADGLPEEMPTVLLRGVRGGYASDASIAVFRNRRSGILAAHAGEVAVVIGSSEKKNRLSEVSGIVHHLPVTIQTLKYHQQVPRETLIVML